ncbi:hypothetical protein KSS87_021187, partial [Heliosperma pusillum]
TDSIKVVEGAIHETSALLEQKWDKIFYTGSGKVGRIIMAAAAKHLTPVILELGGKSPTIVDSNVTARRIIAGKWGCNNGQTCTAVDYILTTKEFAPTLVDALKVELEKCFGKEPMASKDISRVVSLSQFTRLMKLLGEDGVSDTIVLGGQSDADKLKIAPTILMDVPEESALMTEEIFGPLLPIVTVEKLEDSFGIIKSKPKPLAAYLFTKNEKLKTTFVNDISAGGILINDTILHLTVSSLPFGGVGESGMGNYHGKFSFDAFSHKKSVLYRSFDGDAAVRMKAVFWLQCHYNEKAFDYAIYDVDFVQLLEVIVDLEAVSLKQQVLLPTVYDMYYRGRNDIKKYIRNDGDLLKMFWDYGSSDIIMVWIEETNNPIKEFGLVSELKKQREEEEQRKKEKEEMVKNIVEVEMDDEILDVELNL